MQQTLLTHASQLRVQYSIMFAEELYLGKPISKYSQFKLLMISKKMYCGLCKETYEAAWWAFSSSSSFEECVVKAVNRGHDADTTGAVAGMLAGRYYGLSGIPDHFKDKLIMFDDLHKTALELAETKLKTF